MDRRSAAPAGLPRGLALTLGWSSAGGRDCLRIGGWPPETLAELRALPAAELARRVAVVTGETAVLAAGFQPIAGALVVDDDSVRFTPRHPFVDGTAYAVLHGGRRFTTRRPAGALAPRTTVVAIHPSARRLPLNQLKLYVTFSGPMSEGWAGRAVRISRANDGAAIDGVLLRMDPELWDPGRTRLTLLLDPGRIKRGLAPHEEAGYPLAEGVAIVVEVDAAFRDADGIPLRAPARRRYEVGAAVRSRVDPRSWRISAPAAGTRAPLAVAFDRPLDRALLEGSLSVADATGAKVAGQGSPGPGERSWSFTPRTPWLPGGHRLLVAPRLEDLAGNSLTRVFDRDLSARGDDPLPPATCAVAFSC